VAKHIVSTTFPPLIFWDAHLKLFKHTGLVRNILWIDFFVQDNIENSKSKGKLLNLVLLLQRLIFEACGSGIDYRTVV